MSEHHRVDLAVPLSAVDHVLGAAHTPVTVVEYGDFECPNCKQAVDHRLLHHHGLFYQQSRSLLSGRHDQRLQAPRLLFL
jgi:hypothetical protein